MAFSFFFRVGGVPLAAFSLPPFLLGSGALLPLGWWGPLASFSLWFPRGSWVGGGAFFPCRFLHLASPLASRSTWSTDPQPPRAPAAPCLSASRLARLLLGVDGGTR